MEFRYSVQIVIFSESPLVIYLGCSFAEKYRFEETGFKVWSLSETATQAVVTFPSSFKIRNKDIATILRRIINVS